MRKLKLPLYLSHSPGGPCIVDAGSAMQLHSELTQILQQVLAVISSNIVCGPITFISSFWLQPSVPTQDF